jgi:hypothetical protein
VVIFLVVLCAPPIAQAAVLNGHFDSGLANWDATPTKVNTKASASITVTNESGHPHYAKLYANAQPNTVIDPIYGEVPVGLGGAYATMTQLITANAGDTLAFEYYTDASNYEVGAGFTVEFRTTISESIASETLYNNPTWQTFEVPLPKTGTYNLTYMVGGQSEYGDAGTLKIDNVHLNSVPEPGVMSLLGIGALTCALFAWRRRR